MMMYSDPQTEIEFDDAHKDLEARLDSPLSCSQGHRSSQVLRTQEGGSICLLCFSNLVCNSNSPTFHVSYALSQLSHAISQPDFLRSLLSFNVHFVISPLVQSLSSFDDEQIARQAIELIVEICNAGDASVSGEFVARISSRLATDGLSWSHRQAYTLHCLGSLLNQRKDEAYVHIKAKDNLIYNLIMGLQLPSEEIRGEILFVLYRISVLQCARKDDHMLFTYAPKLVRLLMEVLMKSQSDEVRLNCIAVLKVLTQRGILGHAISSDENAMDTGESENCMQTTDDVDICSLDALFAEAIKAPLLSSDDQVQSTALDLIFQYLKIEEFSVRHIEAMVEENIADYIFEILRLSELKDHLVSSSLRVLYVLSTTKQIFWNRLAIGFTTLVSVLPHIAQVPFHPVQTEMLKIILLGVSNCAGAVSSKHIEDISSALTAMLRRHVNGEMGMPSEAFITASSIFVALIKCPSFNGAANLLISIQEALKYALLTTLSAYDQDPDQLLHSLNLLKEAYMFDHEVNATNSYHGMQLQSCALKLCEQHLIPWFVKAASEMEEESVLGVLEILYSILLERKNNHQVHEFTEFLLSFSWFHLLFQCLGMYPSERMKCRVYLLLSSIVDSFLGNDSGQPIREAASSLPTDPIGLLCLLGQRSTDNQELSSCQSAVLQILYSSSYQDQSLADNKLILTSLEQYILVNKNDLLYGRLDSLSIITLVSLYGQYRGLFVGCLIPYSSEAEKIFFKLVNERNWEFSFEKIHPSSVKWLFQQDEILEQLSSQILNFYAPKLLVTLLDQIVDKNSLDDESILIIHFIMSIVQMNPIASDQLCMHGIGIAIRNVCYSSIYISCQDNHMLVLSFIFTILSSAHPEAIPDDEAWVGVTLKLLSSLTPTATAPVEEWTNKNLLVISILSLILNHSTHQVLTETSKSIILNSTLVSMFQNSIGAAAADLPSNHPNMEKEAVQPLIFLLLLHCFYLRGSPAVLPGYADKKSILPSDGTLRILSRDYCRLMHHGSPLIQLIASYCLVELFRQPNELECTVGFLRSMVAVFQGLIFHSDVRVAINSARCFSMVKCWKIPGLNGSTISSKWCRLIVEELAMLLAAPCSASKVFPKHHKSAVHVATSLLKLNDPPEWMRSVFDEPCISAIIQNMSYANITVELVQLFQELLHLGFLKPDHIRRLNAVFQLCSKNIDKGDIPDGCMINLGRMENTTFGRLEEVCEFLVHLLDHSDDENQVQLLKEIEKFVNSLTENVVT